MRKQIAEQLPGHPGFQFQLAAVFRPYHLAGGNAAQIRARRAAGCRGHSDALLADVADKVATVLREHGLAGEPLGIDVAEMPVLAALTAAGISVTDGQQVFMEARRIKTRDEITLLSQACAMVDAAYDELYGFLRPGVRENECVG